MFEGSKNASDIVLDACGALAEYPRMLIPLLLCWLCYAPLLVALKYHVPWQNYDIYTSLLILFAAILFLSLIFSWSAFMLLELIRQIEMDEKRSTIKCLAKSSINVIIALPIVLVWAILWFILSVLESLFNEKSDDPSAAYNAMNVAQSLAGNKETSLISLGLRLISRGIRMLAFIIYPALAWEKLSVFNSLKKGLSVARLHKAEFSAGFFITLAASVAVFVPPMIMFILSEEFGVIFTDFEWFVLIGYCALAWSFSLYLEQMFVAELYLWHLIWEKEVDQAKKEGRPLPKLEDVKRPSIMDSVADLHLTNINTAKNQHGKV